jgi:hypothetical protein
LYGAIERNLRLCNPRPLAAFQNPHLSRRDDRRKAGDGRQLHLPGTDGDFDGGIRARRYTKSDLDKELGAHRNDLPEWIARPQSIGDRPQAFEVHFTCLQSGSARLALQ